MSLSHVYEWPRAHPRVVDGLLVGLLVLLFVLPPAPGNGGLAVLSAALVLPLWWRRTRPFAVLVVVGAACLVQVVVVDRPVVADVAYLVATYSAAAHSPVLGRRLAALALTPVAGFTAALDWNGWDGGVLPHLLLFGGFLTVFSAVVWVAGDLMRSRRLVLERLAEQNEALHRERDQRAELAAQQERVRIAREMHDVVAHSLSVVVVQADGGAYAAEHAREWDRDQARATLITIAGAARAALHETRGLVGVLRSGDGAGVDYSPTASLDEIPDLVEGLRGAGHPVTLEVTGAPAAVSRETGLAAYRIVQEALTNVLKHAGPRARTTVLVEHGPSLRVEVRDDGRGAAAPDDGRGHGIIGMRERAAAVDGTLTTGAAAGGGFVVRAVLPAGGDT